MPPVALQDQTLPSKEQALFRQLVKQYEVRLLMITKDTQNVFIVADQSWDLLGGRSCVSLPP